MIASLLIILGGLMLLLLLGIPVVFAIGTINLFSFIIERGLGNIPYEVIATRMMYGVKSFPLLAIPFFLFAGKLMNVGGITSRIFNFADCLVGHLKGGLMHANILASMIFAGMSGSSVADAGGLGAIEIKAMDDAGYNRDITLGVTSASSCLGPIIPPSTIAVIYAIAANQSVGKLLIGGLLPGISMGILLMATAVVIANRRKLTPSHSFPSIKEIWLSLKTSSLSLITPIIILGGILLGIVTPTEAATIACFYALILSGLIYKELSLKKLIKIVKEVAQDTAVIMIIISVASLYGWILVRQRIPYYLAEMLLTVTSNKLVLLLILDIFFIIVGCFMSATVSIIIFTPIMLPIVTQFSIDPIHFGILMIFTLSIGVITPPFGQVLFVITRITKESFEFVVRSVLPWYIPLLIGVLLLTFFPVLATWLPNIFLK